LLNKAFEETGGFSERLMAKRIEARGMSPEPAPGWRPAGFAC
jgi:hypothetical protein